MPNKTEIRIGGSGGQGIVLAAQILGKAAILDGKNALQTQAYGAEARGSLATSEVIISDAKIGFPAVRKPDILMVMTQEAADKLLTDFKDDGILIIDSTNVTKTPKTRATIYWVPITETANKTFGGPIYANMIMLGVFAGTTKLITIRSISKAIKASISKATANKNIEAFRKGLNLNR